MRTTVDIPEELMREAMQTSHVKTKTMVIVLGLKELVTRHKLEQMRALRGKLPLTIDVDESRDRTRS